MTNERRETEVQPRKVIFFAGSSMEQHSNVPVQRALQEAGLADEFISYPSLASSEITWAHRFEDMAEDLKQVMTGNERATIIVYSLGASEFIVALLRMLEDRQKKIRNHEEKYEPLDLSNLEIILRSPTGLIQKWSDNLRQIKQGAELIQSSMTGPVNDLEHVLTFLPVVEGNSLSEKQAALQNIMDAFVVAYPQYSALGRSGANNTVESLRQILQLGKSPDHLDEPKFLPLKDKLREIDAQLVVAAKGVEQNPLRFRQLLKRRADILRKEKALDQLFHNDEGALIGEEWQPKKLEKSIVAGMLGMLRVIGRTVCPGNQEVYRWLESVGAQIRFMIPDQEVFTPLEVMQEFFDLQPEKTVHTPGSHITMSNRMSEFVAAFKRLRG